MAVTGLDLTVLTVILVHVHISAAVYLNITVVSSSGAVAVLLCNKIVNHTYQIHTVRVPSSSQNIDSITSPCYCTLHHPYNHTLMKDLKIQVFQSVKGGWRTWTTLTSTQWGYPDVPKFKVQPGTPGSVNIYNNNQNTTFHSQVDLTLNNQPAVSLVCSPNGYQGRITTTTTPTITKTPSATTPTTTTTTTTTTKTPTTTTPTTARTTKTPITTKASTPTDPTRSTTTPTSSDVTTIQPGSGRNRDTSSKASDNRLVIAVSNGVLGAVIITLLIILLICCKLRQTNKQTDKQSNVENQQTETGGETDNTAHGIYVNSSFADTAVMPLGQLAATANRSQYENISVYQNDQSVDQNTENTGEGGLYTELVSPSINSNNITQTSSSAYQNVESSPVYTALVPGK